MKKRIIPIAATALRKAWLKELGGISTVSVKNKEWMTLLKEDTRNSLMIEGHFVSRAELKQLLENPKYSKTDHKILGYFDAALSAYELAFQQYKNNEFKITKSIIHQIHSMMFRSDPGFLFTPGEWRKGPIEIQGTQVKPVSEFHIEQYMEYLISIINQPHSNLTRKVATIHDMFEQIHPFPDGNGRVGRILLNFILVGHGLPNISIKGFEKSRKDYIDALEEATEIKEKPTTIINNQIFQVNFLAIFLYVPFKY